MSPFKRMWEAWRVYRALNRIASDAKVLFEAGHELDAMDLMAITGRIARDDLARVRASLAEGHLREERA